MIRRFGMDVPQERSVYDPRLDVFDERTLKDVRAEVGDNLPDQIFLDGWCKAIAVVATARGWKSKGKVDAKDSELAILTLAYVQQWRLGADASLRKALYEDRFKSS